MKKYIVLCVYINCSIFAKSPIIGVYDLEVEISGRNFKDVLVIDQEQPNGRIRGEFRVPGVFRAPFIGDFEKGLIEGEFYPVENGSKFKVVLEGDFKNVCNVRGTLSQKGEEFGVFVGEQRGCNE